MPIYHGSPGVVLLYVEGYYEAGVCISRYSTALSGWAISRRDFPICWYIYMGTSTTSGQRSGFDSQRYQSIWKVLGLEWVPLSLVSTIEELFERKNCVGIRYADHVAPSICKGWTLTLLLQQEVVLSRYSSLVDSGHFVCLYAHILPFCVLLTIIYGFFSILLLPRILMCLIMYYPNRNEYLQLEYVKLKFSLWKKL
jgi:hypothetical protein